jgi:lipopolysaccharide transport system ATP-binding protein
MTDHAIEVNELSKRFVLNPHRRSSLKERAVRGANKNVKQEHWALRDVSFTVPRGVTLGLVGSNGAGKSTALKVLSGIYRPTSGSVRVNGRLSALLELGAGFHGELTGRENIELNAAILGLSPKEIAAVSDHIVEFADIGDFIDAPVKVYSSGMFVRLGFAVAVNVQPDVLVVDEVIAVGDERFQRKCFDHLFEMRRKGATIVVVSHSLGLLEDVCDEVIWLDAGRVNAYGDAREVVHKYLAAVNSVEAEVGVESMDDLNGPGRHGSGEVRVTDVSWSVNGGEFGRLAMATGDEVVFRIDYEAKVAVANAVFGIGFINEAGVSVSGPNSGATRTWSLAPGAGSVTFTVPRLLLQPAELSLSVAVVDRGHFFDYLDRSYPMRVRSRGSSEPGLVQTLGQWDLHTYQGKVP